MMISKPVIKAVWHAIWPLLAVIASIVLIYFSGYNYGHNKAAEAAAAEKAEIIAIYQGAALAAEIQYSEKLAAAAKEKQKWFDFAQVQSANLAAAYRELDAKSAQLQEQIPHAVKKDGNGFTGIGPDSLRRYNQALGYPD